MSRFGDNPERPALLALWCGGLAVVLASGCASPLIQSPVSFTTRGDDSKQMVNPRPETTTDDDSTVAETAEAKPDGDSQPSLDASAAEVTLKIDKADFATLKTLIDQHRPKELDQHAEETGTNQERGFKQGQPTAPRGAFTGQTPQGDYPRTPFAELGSSSPWAENRAHNPYTMQTSNALRQSDRRNEPDLRARREAPPWNSSGGPTPRELNYDQAGNSASPYPAFASPQAMQALNQEPLEQSPASTIRHVGAMEPLRTGEPAPSNAAPVEPPQPISSQHAIEDAIRSLERELRESPLDERREERTRKEVALRLLRISSLEEADWKKALSPIQHLSADEKEAWSHLLYTMKELHEFPSSPRLGIRATAALLALRQAEAALSNLGILQVRNLKLCTKVTSYGRYEEFPELRFVPGQQVILYAEVENFSAEPRSDGYETKLEGECTIYNADKQAVGFHRFGVESEISANRRRDFFFPYRYQIPVDLTPGQYTLTLSIEDKLASKFDEQSILFTVENRR